MTDSRSAHLGLVAVFEDGEAAMRAAEALWEGGIPQDHLGLVGQDAGSLRAGLEAIGFPVMPGSDTPEQLAEHLEPDGRDGMFGAALGTCAGLAVGLGPFLIPGLGPMLFVHGGLAILGEALATSAVGAGIGAFFGTLFESQVEERHRAQWEQTLKAGGALLVVRGDRDEVERALELLAPLRAQHVDRLSF